HQDKHRIVDFLLTTQDKQYSPMECTDGPADQPCRAKLAQPEGFYEMGGSRLRRSKSTVRLTAHTAIENSSLRARAAQFFTTEVLESRQQFIGSIWAKPEAEELLMRLSQKETIELTLGRGG